MVSFAVKKDLGLIRSHLSIFSFIFITQGGGLKKLLLRFMSKNILLMFSMSFIVSGLTFNALIHFEFVYDIRVLISFIYM